MSQRRSKQLVNVTANGRPRTPGPQVSAKLPGEFRSRAARGPVRPLAKLAPTDGSADMQGATGSQSYLQWAGFMAGAPNGDFGFGAYFVGEETGAADEAQSGAGAIRYTWTPSRRG
jgi:hypothetical protein